MSNFTQVAWNPRERVARAANYFDDFFGHHEYGVRFDGDDHIYRPDEVEIPLDLVLIPIKVGVVDDLHPMNWNPNEEKPE